MDKQQKVKVSDKVIIEPVANKFISSQTGSEYMLNYLISLPEFDLYFEVEPYNKKQEMIFGTINYWEGGIKIKAKSKGKEIMGRGFMELVGSPMKKNVFNVYMNRYKKLLQHPLKTISREFSQKLKAYK
jgi:predicted secreted hydrolase